MGDKSGIEWTDATWNIFTGCTQISEACAHCYITRTPPFRMAGRTWSGDGGIGSTTGVLIHEDRLSIPLRWTRRRRVFVNSLSDVFHEEIPDDLIARMWAVMMLAHEHTFQVLTKRHGRMRSLLNSEAFRIAVMDHAWTMAHGEQDVAVPERHARRYKQIVRDCLHHDGPGARWPVPNVWVGVTVENQHWADIRVPALMDTNVAVRFLSCEPLLGPVSLSPDWTVDWVIAGGESGPGARPMHPDWARWLRDQCVATGIAYHFKQWGEWAPTRFVGAGTDGTGKNLFVPDSEVTVEKGFHPIEGREMRRVGKKAAGRLLDGRTWDQEPERLVTA